MPEHPETWYEILTTGYCIRVDEKQFNKVVARYVTETVRAMWVTDLYGDAVLVVCSHIEAFASNTREMRDLARARQLLFNAEQREFDEAHPSFD